MIANPENFKAIVLSNRKQKLDDAVFVLSDQTDQTISATENVDLLGITVDNKVLKNIFLNCVAKLQDI